MPLPQDRLGKGGPGSRGVCGVCVRKTLHPSMAFPWLRAPQLPLTATRGSCASGYVCEEFQAPSHPSKALRVSGPLPIVILGPRGADETSSACPGVSFQETTHRGGGYIWILPALYCQRFRGSRSKTNEAAISKSLLCTHQEVCKHVALKPRCRMRLRGTLL